MDIIYIILINDIDIQQIRIFLIEKLSFGSTSTKQTTIKFSLQPQNMPIIPQFHRNNRIMKQIQKAIVSNKFANMTIFCKIIVLVQNDHINLVSTGCVDNGTRMFACLISRCLGVSH